jgi:hypothetical protein
LEKAFDRYRDLLTTREMLWIIVFFSALLGLSILLTEILRLSSVPRVSIIAVLLVCLLANTFAWLGKTAQIARAAVVLEETQARFEPSDQATAHFHLFSGEKIVVQKIDGAWAKIERPDGKLGWVEVKNFEKIQQE